MDRGVAFEFIKGLLSLNDVSDANPLVEVILLSKNDPDTGFRVFRSIEAYGLPITRAVFLQGKSALDYIPAFNISLFLSGNENDVKAAIDRSYPAGLVVKSEADYDIVSDGEIRIAFHFDGVLADDESERKYQEGGIVDKGSVMSVLRPHIFFDDQIDHLKSTSKYTPSVHIPFGVKNL
nr:5'-nucleotidase [Chromobacterium violaceum]